MAREPKAEHSRVAADEAPTKRPNKTNLVLDLLKSPDGATIDQLVNATGWLPHATRAALPALAPSVLLRDGSAMPKANAFTALTAIRLASVTAIT